MSTKPPSKAVTRYTIYAASGALLELAIMMVIVVWGLPYAGIELPVWGIVTLAILLLAFSYYTYSTGSQALNRKMLNDIERMVGSTGVVVAVNEDGCYVKIHGELWDALSDSALSTGEEITIVAVDGLKLVVEKKA
jgi:membrane-bound serine protease (ClpP class)